MLESKNYNLSKKLKFQRNLVVKTKINKTGHQSLAKLLYRPRQTYTWATDFLGAESYLYS